jgi:acetyl-CoA C-acetyltransferase
MIDLIGFAHTPFTRAPGADIEALMARVATESIADAGLEASDIDAVVIGHFGHGLIEQGFVAGLSSGLAAGLRGKPSLRVESACASGSAAVHQAAMRIAAGRAKRVLVIGAEVMSSLPTREVGQALLKASYVKDEAQIEGGFAGMFARIAGQYAQRFGNPHDAMARIAVKAHANGVHNPYAQYRKPVELADCSVASDKNPSVVGMLLRSDCSPISDGAAALVMSASSAVPAGAPRVRLRAMAQVNDVMPTAGRDMSELAGARQVWQQVLAEGGVTLDQLAGAEVHDCFTVAELMLYEAIGLTPPGRGHIALDEGWVEAGGRLAVNLSGGLKSKGHPVGATGVSMHVLAAWLLLGRYRPGALRAGADMVGVLNMGGAAVTNFASLLERVH